MTLRPDLLVLFASGYAETDALERALGRPADMIRKPFDTASLGGRVAQAFTAGMRRPGHAPADGPDPSGGAP